MTNIVPYGQGGNSRQLAHRTNGAHNKIAARQSTTEHKIKAQREVGELGAFEVNYLIGIGQIVAESNPAAGPAVEAIVRLTVGGIIRSVAEFGSSL